MNPKRPAPRRSAIKNSKVKDKERILKAAREKQLVMYKGTPIRLSAAFQQKLCSPEEWHDIFKVLKEKKKTKPSNQEYSTQQSYHLE